MLSESDLKQILHNYESHEVFNAQIARYQTMMGIQKRIEGLRDNLSGYIKSKEFSVSSLCFLMSRLKCNDNTQGLALENVLLGAKTSGKEKN